MFAPSRAGLTPERFRQLTAFMAERHAIYMRKVFCETYPLATRCDARTSKDIHFSSKMSKAWGDYPTDHWDVGHLTVDPILQRFRFCNVYRELDKVTVWIREHIREPYAEHEHLWFMLCIARHINWPDTLAEMMAVKSAWPASEHFKPENMTAALSFRQAQGEKVYTGAYMIRAEQHDRPWRYWPKVRYSAEIVLGKLWTERVLFHEALLAYPGHQPTLQETWALFQEPQYTGWGPFMAYQVVVDMRHTRYLRNAPDINEWAAVGPGSARGLNRLHGRPVKQALKQEQALAEMLELRLEMAQPGALAPWLELPDLSDVQNCLCEFDKYERVRLGEGRPRALYVPGRGG